MHFLPGIASTGHYRRWYDHPKGKEDGNAEVCAYISKLHGNNTITLYAPVWREYYIQRFSVCWCSRPGRCFMHNTYESITLSCVSSEDVTLVWPMCCLGRIWDILLTKDLQLCTCKYNSEHLSCCCSCTGRSTQTSTIQGGAIVRVMKRTKQYWKSFQRQVFIPRISWSFIYG